jgi:two-component system response regulator MtrA
MQKWDTEALGEFQGRNSHTVTLDDDPVVPRMIQEILGIRTVSFASVTALKASFDQLDPVGVFVDIHLAGNECGLDIVPQIKARWPASPIIVITGDLQESLIGQALASGADDFILKPIRPGELVARLLTRKSEIDLRNNQTVLHFGDLVLNLRHKSLVGPKGQCFQSAREVEILAYLIRVNGMVIDKANLKRRIWGNIAVSDNALDRKLFEVRKAIKGVSDTVEIGAVYGQGIVLRSKPILDDRAAAEGHHGALAPAEAQEGQGRWTNP